MRPKIESRLIFPDLVKKIVHGGNSEKNYLVKKLRPDWPEIHVQILTLKTTLKGILSITNPQNKTDIAITMEETDPIVERNKSSIWIEKVSPNCFHFKLILIVELIVLIFSKHTLKKAVTPCGACPIFISIIKIM